MHSKMKMTKFYPNVTLADLMAFYGYKRQKNIKTVDSPFNITCLKNNLNQSDSQVSVIKPVCPSHLQNIVFYNLVWGY